MAHLVPKDLKGEERLFVVPGVNLPITKKSIIYNGPATLMAIIVGKVFGNQILFITIFIILNAIAYPLGNTKRHRKKFDNGYMNNDMYFKKRLSWTFKKGGNIYLSHRIDEEVNR